MLPLIRKQDASSVVLVMFSLCLGDSRGRDRMVVGLLLLVEDEVLFAA
jgi:hypothetical protein